MRELERLAAACIFPGFPGYEPPDTDAVSNDSVPAESEPRWTAQLTRPQAEEWIVEPGPGRKWVSGGVVAA